jgi:sulfide:quinone oxidoreductase
MPIGDTRAARGAPSRSQVLIAGGGVAALEALLALRFLTGDALDIDLLTPEDRFVYRPVTVAEPFDRDEARRFDLAVIAEDQRARLVKGSIARVEPHARVVHTADGAELPYDALLVATGARPVAAVTGALTFGGRDDVAALRGLLGEIERGKLRSVAFALPPGVSWPMPLYELALMTAAHATAHGITDLDVTLVTHEPEPLAMFGGAASSRVGELLAEGEIDVRCNARPTAATDHRLLLEDGDHVLADRTVALPRLVGPSLEGLPRDAWGFVPVDEHGRVSGQGDVFAAGDVTSFPIKQGGLAAQQAEAAARAIAARAGADVEPRPFRPVMRGLLLTGGVPLYLRAEPQGPGPPHSVAIDAPVRLQPSTAGPSSAAATQALWWPPSKIAGRHLAPYLAAAHPLPPAYDDAGLELALTLADADAGWGDYEAALRALDTAEALAPGGLAPAYEAKRSTWRRAVETGDERRQAGGPPPVRWTRGD